MLESIYQAELKKTLARIFPGCIILKMDLHQQGWPDLLILFNTRWATLEVKASERSKHQPNQDYYVEQFSKMTYSSFIYPENEHLVLKELQDFFEA